MCNSEIQSQKIDNSIYADNHTLFIEKIPASAYPVVDESGEVIEGVFKEGPEYTIYKLFIGDFLETGNGVQRILAELQKAQPNDTLEFHISSRGGSVDELLEIYNICDTIFHNRVTCYCNYGYSAGAMAFLFGKERLVYEHSDWMMHSYTAGFGGKRQDLLDHLEHEDKKLKKFFNQLLKPYFTKKELKKIQEGKDFWLNSEEMLKRGIATHIMIKGEVLTAEEYLKMIRSNKKPLKNKNKKKNKEIINHFLTK